MKVERYSRWIWFSFLVLYVLFDSIRPRTPDMTLVYFNDLMSRYEEDLGLLLATLKVLQEECIPLYSQLPRVYSENCEEIEDEIAYKEGMLLKIRGIQEDLSYVDPFDAKDLDIMEEIETHLPDWQENLNLIHSELDYVRGNLKEVRQAFERKQQLLPRNPNSHSLSV